MYYTDSHIHLQDYKTQDIKNVVISAEKNNVRRFINASSHPADWDKVAKLAEEYRQIIPAFGVHPWYISAAEPKWDKKLAELLRQYPHAIVGECGIDRYKNSDTAEQEKFLLTHILLAKEYARPLIIHAVKADEIMASFFHQLPPATVFHSFAGSAEWGKFIQKHGFYIGINQAIWRRKNAETLLKSLDLHHILLETDGPYQSLVSGEESLPENIPLIAGKIAALHGISEEKMLRIIADNQQRFLGDT